MRKARIIIKYFIYVLLNVKQYVGSTGKPLKTRWYSYIWDFKVHKENGTETSKCIWKLKRSILQHIGEVRIPQRVCMTCTYEKMEVANADGGTLLNIRNELIYSYVYFKNLYFKTKENLINASFFKLEQTNIKIDISNQFQSFKLVAQLNL